MIMWIGDGRAWIIVYGILILIATQITMVFAGCAIQPDANGHVDIPNSWTTVPHNAFCDCVALNSVIIPSTVEVFEQGAFARSSLEQVEIPDSVTSIGVMAFEGCTSLETVSMGNSVTSIGDDAFSKCWAKI